MFFSRNEFYEAIFHERVVHEGNFLQSKSISKGVQCSVWDFPRYSPSRYPKVSSLVCGICLDTVQVDIQWCLVQCVRAVTRQPYYASHRSPLTRIHHTPPAKHWSEPFSPLKGPVVLSVCGGWCVVFPRSWRVAQPGVIIKGSSTRLEGIPSPLLGFPLTPFVEGVLYHPVRTTPRRHGEWWTLIPCFWRSLA